MNYRIKSVEAVRHPVLRVAFDDGLSGEYDLTQSIATGPIFAPLEDEPFFRKVSIAEDGHSFGWNLDRPGEEIDLFPDATRIRIETRIVEELASQYRARRSAAE
jgi:hypothetical protein